MMQKDNNNYQWFTYGRSPLDSVREGDRAADYMDRYCSNQNRIMHINYTQQIHKHSTILNVTEPLTIDVFPNPASLYVQVKSNHIMQSIMLYDAKMRLMQTVLTAGKYALVNFDKLSKGNYILEVMDEYNKTGLQKIVKQ